MTAKYPPYTSRSIKTVMPIFADMCILRNSSAIAVIFLIPKAENIPAGKIGAAFTSIAVFLQKSGQFFTNLCFIFNNEYFHFCFSSAFFYCRLLAFCKIRNERMNYGECSFVGIIICDWLNNFKASFAVREGLFM